jgi:hypothetical protein
LTGGRSFPEPIDEFLLLADGRRTRCSSGMGQDVEAIRGIVGQMCKLGIRLKPGTPRTELTAATRITKQATP